MRWGPRIGVGVLVLACACTGDDGGRESVGEGGIVPTGDGSGASGDQGSDSADGTAGEDDGMPCNYGNVEFSFIWIANSPDGTVSKIDTQAAVEVARYRTGDPATNPDPSRTSVQLNGDVAVLNRGGSVVKIAALPERCVDANGDGTIQTSTGPGDVLPWGSDECVSWDQPLPHFEPSPGDHTWGARPVAWDGGIPNPEDSCDRGPARLWVGWYEGTDTNVAGFRRLAGMTGATLDEVMVPEWSQIPIEASRPYGGAVDRDGNFWALGKPYQLLRIDGETLEYDLYFGSVLDEFYGLALDADGDPWLAMCSGAVRWFNRDLEAFVNVGDTGGCLRGIAIDNEGRGWAAGNDPCRLVEIDIEGETITNANIGLAGCVEPVGVSIDIDGAVWVVDRGANRAYKIDPDTYMVLALVDGLINPYTYSDMTGAGLSLQFFPEE